jgi:glycosyltransferase involved in cell wall biosynthesis
MRIGFEAKRAFFNERGLGNYARNLIRGLCQYHPQEAYFLYTPHFRKNLLAETLDAYENLHLRLPPSWMKSVLGSIWRTYLMGNDVLGDRLDIFHGLSHEVPAVKRDFSPKLIVTIHDLIFLRYPEFYKKADRAIYLKKIKHSTERCDSIIAISEQTKADLVEFLQIPAQKIEVIYQSCDEVFYQPATEGLKLNVKKRFGLPDDYMLYVGALSEHKNILMILQAMTMSNDKTLPLVIVGNGKNYREALEIFIAHHQLQSRVIFLNDKGWATSFELASIYQMASVFIYPSLFEGFGIPIIEALYSKTPVITSIGGCFPEAGGPQSLYIDPKNPEALFDAIQKVLGDETLAHQMAETGFQYAQRFHWEQTTKKLMEYYQQIESG